MLRTCGVWHGTRSHGFLIPPWHGHMGWVGPFLPVVSGSDGLRSTCRVHELGYEPSALPTLDLSRPFASVPALMTYPGPSFLPPTYGRMGDSSYTPLLMSTPRWRQKNSTQGVAHASVVALYPHGPFFFLHIHILMWSTRMWRGCLSPFSLEGWGKPMAVQG